MATDEQIRAEAYNIWDEEGRPDGKDVEHYLRAKKILEDQEAIRIMELAPVPPTIQLAQPPKNIPRPAAPSKRSIRSRHKKK
jgi:hypothetical protein